MLRNGYLLKEDHSDRRDRKEREREEEIKEKEDKNKKYSKREKDKYCKMLKDDMALSSYESLIHVKFVSFGSGDETDLKYDDGDEMNLSDDNVFIKASVVKKYFKRDYELMAEERHNVLSSAWEKINLEE